MVDNIDSDDRYEPPTRVDARVFTQVLGWLFLVCGLILLFILLGFDLYRSTEIATNSCDTDSKGLICGINIGASHYQIAVLLAVIGSCVWVLSNIARQASVAIVALLVIGVVAVNPSAWVELPGNLQRSSEPGQPPGQAPQQLAELIYKPDSARDISFADGGTFTERVKADRGDDQAVAFFDLDLPYRSVLAFDAYDERDEIDPLVYVHEVSGQTGSKVSLNRIFEDDDGGNGQFGARFFGVLTPGKYVLEIRVLSDQPAEGREVVVQARNFNPGVNGRSPATAIKFGEAWTTLEIDSPGDVVWAEVIPGQTVGERECITLQARPIDQGDAELEPVFFLHTSRPEEVLDGKLIPGIPVARSRKADVSVQPLAEAVAGASVDEVWQVQAPLDAFPFVDIEQRLFETQDGSPYWAMITLNNNKVGSVQFRTVRTDFSDKDECLPAAL